MKLSKLVKVAETLKGEGFAGYENDQDPETHVKIQAKDHARTGSAQQAQYDGTEGKSESKEKPLKVLTDGELEEVEKLKALALETKDALKPVEGQGKMKPQSGRKPDGREKPDYFESQRPYGFGKLGRKEPQTSRGQADDATQTRVGIYSARDPRDGSTARVQFPPREAGEDTTAGDKKLNQHKPVATGHASSGNAFRKEEKIPLDMYDHETITEIKEEDYDKEGKYSDHKLRKVPRTGKPAKDLKHEPLGEAAENRLSDSARMERAAFGIPQSDETYDQEEERRRGGKQPKTGKAPKDIKASKLGKIRKKAMELLKRDDWDKSERRDDEAAGVRQPRDRDSPEDDEKKSPYASREEWENRGREMQHESRTTARDTSLPDRLRSHATGLDERIGQELGEVPRSRVIRNRNGKKIVSDQGKHVGSKFIDDAFDKFEEREARTGKKPTDDEVERVGRNANDRAVALTIREENAEKWKSFRKAVNTINKRRGRGRRISPKVIEKDAIPSKGYENPPPEQLARPKREKFGDKKLERQFGGDWHKQQLNAKRYRSQGGDKYPLEQHPRSGSKRKWEKLHPQSGEKYEGIVDHKGQPVLVGDKKRDQRGAHQGRNTRGRQRDPNEQKNTGQAGFAQSSHRSPTHDRKLEHGYVGENNRAATKLPDEETLNRQIQAKEHGKLESKERPKTIPLAELKRRAEILGQKSPQSNTGKPKSRDISSGGTQGDKWMEHYANNRYKLMTPEELDKLTKAIQILKEGTNAANGTSPRGANFLGTNDTEAFNVRHNGGRNTKRIGKKPEDLGNFP